MQKQDMEVMVNEVLQDFEGGELEAHEIQARLRQILDQMKVFGMALPDDLVALEKKLSDEFADDSQ